MTRTRVALLAVLAACSGHDVAPAAPPPPADATIALFERRTAADPRDHISATTLAELRLAASDFVRAEQAARTALERQPGHPRAVSVLARALHGQGRTDEAKRLIEEVLDREPRNSGALCVAFDLALATGNVRIAETYADRLLAIDEQPATISRMARLAETKGEGDRAASLFRRAAADAKDLGGTDEEIAEYLNGARRAETGTR